MSNDDAPILPRPRGWRGALLLLGLGALLGLGQAPFDFPWGLFLAVPWIWMMAAKRRGVARFWIGWWAGVGYFAFSLHWIIEPFLVDMARTGWMAPFALVLLAGGLALFWAVGFALARGPVSLVAAWTLAEAGRAMLLTGFPWALIGYGWLETPMAQAAAVIGPYGLGAASLLLALLPLMHRGGVLLLVLLLGSASMWGSFRVQPVPPAGPVVRLVQPNAAQHLKWRADMVPVFYARLLGETAAKGRYDAVIWPEVAVPYLVHERPDLNAEISRSARGAPVLLGTRRVDGSLWFNSLAVLGPGGRIAALYDKHHLVPFGEYLPLPALWDRFGLRGLAQNAGNYGAGKGPQSLTLDGLPSLQPLICYEMIFPHEILRGAVRPQWLVQITNDAWFGAFSGPYQHLAQARMRAIEFGLPVARAANTGVSAMIDPHGGIVAALPLQQAGHLDAPLPQALPPTIYAQIGDGPILFALLLIWIGARLVGIRRKA